MTMNPSVGKSQYYPVLADAAGRYPITINIKSTPADYVFTVLSTFDVYHEDPASWIDDADSVQVDVKFDADYSVIETKEVLFCAVFYNRLQAMFGTRQVIPTTCSTWQGNYFTPYFIQ